MSERRQKVLVVEENYSVQEAIKALLEDEFCVLTASTGSEALVMLQQHEDVRVVTTSTLRGQQVNGFVLAQEIRAQEIGSQHVGRKKIILVTGADGLTIPENIRARFNAIVHKPFLSALPQKIRFFMV